MKNTQKIISKLSKVKSKPEMEYILTENKSEIKKIHQQLKDALLIFDKMIEMEELIKKHKDELK